MEITKQKGTETVKRTELEDTPFIIVSMDGKHFGSMGNYKVTDFYDDFEKAKKATLKMTWSRVVQVCLILIKQEQNNEEFKEIIKTQEYEN